MQIEPYASTLQMADKTCKTSVRAIKYVLIHIDKFILFISIGNIKVVVALINLGASVNIISLSMVERIGYLQIDSSASTL